MWHPFENDATVYSQPLPIRIRSNGGNILFWCHTNGPSWNWYNYPPQARALAHVELPCSKGMVLLTLIGTLSRHQDHQRGRKVAYNWHVEIQSPFHQNSHFHAGWQNHQGNLKIGNCNTMPQRCAPRRTRTNWALAISHHRQQRSNQPPSHRVESWTPRAAVLTTWAHFWNDGACWRFWATHFCPTTYTC